MRLITLICLLVVPSVFVSVVANEPESFTYVRWKTQVIAGRPLSEQVTISPSQNYIRFGGDAYYDAKFCEKGISQKCFTSKLHSFSVPQNHLSEGASWRYEEKLFEVVSCNFQVAIFDNTVKNLCLIKSVRDDGSALVEWLWSRNRGLVGFAQYDKQRTFALTYWMSEKVGFGYEEHH